MSKQFIKLELPQVRDEFEGALEDFLDKEALESWKNRENKHVGFYDSVIVGILDGSHADELLEENKGYYKAVFYNEEEVDKVREYGLCIHKWDVKLGKKSVLYAKEHSGDYDHVYLVDEQLPEILEKTKKLYDLLKANDEKYDFLRSWQELEDSRAGDD